MPRRFLLGFALALLHLPSRGAEADLTAARALLAARRPAEAQAAFERLHAADPANAEVNHTLGQLANRRGDPAQAIPYFTAAATAEPHAGRHQQGLGDAYGRQAERAGIFGGLGLARKCVAAYERAVALEPANVEFRLSLLEFYRLAPALVGGGTAKAQAQVDAIRALDPVRGRIAAATLLAGEKRTTEAFAEFAAALQAQPDDVVALYQLGRLAALTGAELDRGAAALGRYLELPEVMLPQAPGHASGHWRLGQVRERQGDREGARAALEAALRLEPGFKPAAEALRRLR
jgi:tetratricopeptide (TPR) repeat protein